MSAPALGTGESGFIERIMLEIREGCASADDVAALRELLGRSREARRLYLLGLQLDCLLQTVGVEESHSETTLRPISFWKRPAGIAFAAGLGLAALFVFLAVFAFPDSGGGAPVADVKREAAGAVLVSQVGSGLEGAEGAVRDSLENGKYRMAEGIARIDFSNGAQLVIEAPAEFEIIGEASVAVTRGKVWAFCPFEAHGFKISTPGGRDIVDVGTEFGVEVTATGGTDVHVFQGAVDLSFPGSETVGLNAGNSATWSTVTPELDIGEADYSKFKDPGDLQRMRIEAAKEMTRNRDDLLVYYGFSELSGGLLRNGVKGSPASSNGMIEGAQAVSGRLAGSGALRFEKPGDSVALTVPRYDALESFTIAMWIRVNHLDTALSALFNSDGWEEGDTHFQITRNGALRAGSERGRGYESENGVVVPGQWQLVAVVWEGLSKAPGLFCDGQRLSLTWNPNDISFSSSQLAPSSLPGESRIGSWAKPVFRDNRDFKGTIDEVMVFDRALGDSEIRKIYENGKP